MALGGKSLLPLKEQLLAKAIADELAAKLAPIIESAVERIVDTRRQ